MEPETVRDALQRLSEVQILQEYLPPEVTIARMNELAQITATLVKKQGTDVGASNRNPRPAQGMSEPSGDEPAAA